MNIEHHNINELFQASPSELQVPLANAITILNQLEAVTDDHNRVINPADKLIDIMTSPHWKMQRETLIALANSFKYHPDNESLKNKPLTQELIEESRFPQLEVSQPESLRMLHPESGRFLKNVLHQSLCFSILEGVISQEYCDRSLEFFKAMADLTMSPREIRNNTNPWRSKKWNAYEGYLSEDNREVIDPEKGRQGWHFRFLLQPQSGNDPNRRQKESIEAFIRPSYYPIEITRRHLVDPELADLEDVDTVIRMIDHEAVNHYRMIPGQSLPPELYLNPHEEIELEKLRITRTSRIILTHNPTFPDDNSHRKPENTRGIKIGIHDGRIGITFISEDSSIKRSYTFLPLTYLYPPLHPENTSPYISDHINEKNQLPHTVPLGFMLFEFAKILTANLPEYLREDFYTRLEESNKPTTKR